MEKAKVRTDVVKELEKLKKNILVKRKKEQCLLQQLFASSQWQKATCVGVTKSMGLELSTEPIIQKAWQEGKNVVIPKTYSKYSMKFISYLPNTPTFFTKFGVEEPHSNDIIDKTRIHLLIVPGVAFNQQGYRIGFGGGFYDRYLSDYTGNTCSLVFKEQIREEWYPEKHDIAIQKIFKESI